jgi:hypothetical protein
MRNPDGGVLAEPANRASIRNPDGGVLGYHTQSLLEEESTHWQEEVEEHRRFRN